MEPDPLRPVRVYFPDWSARRIAENCRAGRIPGAVKVGGEWMIRQSDVDALVTGEPPKTAPAAAAITAESADDFLARCGVAS